MHELSHHECHTKASSNEPIRCVNLEKLVATNNQIQSLPHELGRLTKLKSFDLTSNKLTVVPPGIIFYFIYCMVINRQTEVAMIPTLEKLDLSLNPVIDSIDAAARKGQENLLKFLRSEEYDAIYYRVCLFLILAVILCCVLCVCVCLEKLVECEVLILFFSFLSEMCFSRETFTSILC
jgi:hypothetical protein